MEREVWTPAFAGVTAAAFPLSRRERGPGGEVPWSRAFRPGTHGVTLIELLVALTVLALLAAMAGLAWRPGGWERRVPPAGEVVRAIAAARQQATESGRPVTIRIAAGTDSVPVTAFPGGSIIGADQWRIDPLAGAVSR